MYKEWDGETKIEEMDLDQIKSMMCPMSNGDPLKCVGCASEKTCKAGQRVNALLEEETIFHRKGRASGGDKRRAKAIKMARAAAASKDPVAFVMKQYGYDNEGEAKDRIRDWKNKYPEAIGDLKISSDRNASSYDYLKQALMSGDPYRWYGKNCHYGRKMAEKVMENGLKRHPELRELLNKKPEEPEEDEVSLEDFLDSIPEEKEEVSVVETGRTHDVSKVDTEQKATNDQEAPVKDVQKVLMSKYQEMVAEKERLEERIKCIKDDMEALAKVVNLFIPSTETVK